MSDAVMVPREAKRQLIVDLDAAPFTREFFDALNGYATGGSGRCLDTLSIWNARLAASPSVGGWGDISTAPKDGTLVDLWTSYGERVAGAKWTNGVWREWALDGFDSMGWVRLEGTATHWMPLPPPPSVSTGSRPQEAVPTEWSERPEVVLQYAQQVATFAAKRVGCVDEWRPLGDVYGCLTQIDNCLTGLTATPQPADGCSSNEGAGK